MSSDAPTARGAGQVPQVQVQEVVRQVAAVVYLGPCGLQAFVAADSGQPWLINMGDLVLILPDDGYGRSEFCSNQQ